MSETNPAASNYEGNSLTGKAKPPEAKPNPEKVTFEPIAVGKTKKKPIMRRFLEAMTGDDVHSVGRFVTQEVLLPAFKNMVADAFTQGAERMIFGDGRMSSSSTRSRTGYTAYNRVGPQSRRPPWDEPEKRTMSQRARATHDFREIILDTREEAMEVLDQLRAAISQYDVVSLNDLYQMVSITGSFTDDNWGWNDLRFAGVKRIREGYLLDLPAPISLK